MKVSGYTIEVGAAEAKSTTTTLIVRIPVVDVSSGVEVVGQIRELASDDTPAAKPAKGAKGAAVKAAGKKGKKDPEPEPDEDDDEDADDEDADDEEEEEDDEDADADDEEEEEDSGDEDGEAPAKGKGKGTAAAERPTVKLTPGLKKAEKLRTVIQELLDQGLKTKKDLTAACVALKDKLPVLKSISDLETRVPRAVELINPKIK